MENPIDHITKSAQDIRLTAKAAERIRARLVTHMREHPVVAKPVHSPYQHFFIQSPFMSLLRKPVAALMLVVLVSFGGVSTYAAAGSLPGEPLYTVKVGIIEPMKTLLAVTPEARAALSISIAETRVSEVEQLAVKERLTPEQGVKSQKGFDRSLHVARAKIADLKEENPKVAAKLEASLTASLDARETALSSFALGASTTNANEARSFAMHVKSKVHGNAKRSSPDKDADTGTARESGSGYLYTTAALMIEGDVASTTSATSTLAAPDPKEESEVEIPDVRPIKEGIWHRLGF